MTDSKQHSELVEQVNKGLWSHYDDDKAQGKVALDSLEEQLDTAQQTLLEVAQEGYERVQQKRYEELLEQLETWERAYRRYANHYSDCDRKRHGTHMVCSCGMHDVFASNPASEPKEDA